MWRGFLVRGFRLTSHLLLLTACAVTPLSNRIAVGEEAFVIGVGEGADSMTDLYAAPAAGGSFVRLTFTRPEERLPRLSPQGTAVAFVRRDGAQDGARWSLVVLDLRTTVERSAQLPGAAAPTRIGWTADGSAAIVLAGGYFTLSTVPGKGSLVPVPPQASLAADSMTRELLGDPPSAMVRECAGGGLCITAANGEVGALDPGATDAIRWGPDSVAYLTPRGFTVRPLAGGPSRSPDWRGKPSHLRNLTYHPGIPAR